MRGDVWNMKSYLCGTTRVEFRKTLISFLESQGCEVIDPASHGLADEGEYTEWDLAGIDRADFLFAFMDSSNPSGYGLNFECGYATAKAKHIVFLNLMGNDWRGQYFGMVRARSTVCVSLDD